MRAADFFALPPSLGAFAQHFSRDAAPWEWIRAIREALADLRPQAPDPLSPGVAIEGVVHLDPSVKLPHACTIIGPAWIGARTEIRPGAFIRGNVIVGEDCVLGNSCEFKNSLLMDGVDVPHFSYVGDSILGNKAHLGAGVICSNLRSDRKPVRVRLPDGSAIDSGLRKFGAIVGEGVEIGCNCVLQPGSILGQRAIIFPLTPFRGVLAPDTIAFVRSSGIETKPRHD